jgi:hypothetical protein
MKQRTRGHRRRRWVGLALAIVVASGIGVYLWGRQYRARPVTLEEARDRLTEVPAAASDQEGRPALGVYEYAGSGTDRLSPPSLSQSQGPTIPGTVEPLANGCWRFRVDYSTNHWQSSDYCRTGAGIEEVAGETFQRWVIGAAPVDNTTTTTCADGALYLPTRPAQALTWRSSCDIANDLVKGKTVSSGSTRYIGTARLKVGGTTVDTVHLRRVRTLSGGQDGTETIDLWVLADTGLPVRNRRTIDLTTSTPIGDSHYTERGEFQLQSLAPTS